MAGVFPRKGEQIALEALVNKTAPQSLVLKLFTNDYTPVDTSTDANFTEATGYGYAHIDLDTGGNWTYTAGDPSDVTYTECEFTFTGALGNVYGYYIVQVTSGYLVAAERFSDGPYNIQNNGDKIKITPKITAE